MIDRRSFLKVMGAAAGVTLITLSLHNQTEKGIQKNEIPGSGREGHFTPQEMEEIDVDAFVATCARCGICASVCPFNAIRFKGISQPVLTSETRNKCPGYDLCGACVANCPTDALKVAFEALPYKTGTINTPWWKGPDSKKTKDAGGQNKGD